jgi:hypothetical protein
MTEATPDSLGDILGWIFPRRTRCPTCTCRRHARAGCSREARIQYRRCTDCKRVYKVIAIAVHLDRGGDQSEIVAI